MSLKQKTLKGVLWTFSQQVGVQGINFIVLLILARLLLPEDFGLIAMIQVFISIGKALMDGGMTSSLIRTKNPNQIDYSTVFFINLIISLLLYVILFFSAPLIADFFNQELLTSIVRIYTISFIIQALVGVQTTRLTKEMNFKLQMYMQLPSTFIGGIIGVGLAYSGYGVWSLVWMHLVSTVLFMLQHWFWTDWRPDFIINKERLKYHFNFGYKLTLSSLLTSVYTNSYTIIIGKFFSPAQLGFYNQADTLRMFPVKNLTAALQKVTYPVFSSIQDQDERLKSAFKRITILILFIVAPIMLLLILIAKPLFVLILTEKWLPAVLFFQILCVASIAYPLSMYNLNIILAKGRSDLHIKLEVIKKSISFAFLLLIIPFGIYGVVYAAGISMLVHAYFNSLYSGRLINYPLREQLLNFLPILIMAFISFFITYLMINYLENSFDFNLITEIILNTLLFCILYMILIYNFQKSILTELKVIVKQIKNKE